MKQLSGWGRHPVLTGLERESEDLERASAEASLSRGLGRSYGDASLPADAEQSVLATRRANRILAFDPEHGVLRVEAGFSLREFNEIFPARGWAIPVSPGTQFVTFGGMVASDVHGKNHHVAGCFGEHVTGLRLRTGDGRLLEIGPREEGELFRATLGGMGLTGHILEVEVKLEAIESFWIWRRDERAGNLDELLAKLRNAARDWPFTMAWIDTSARGPSLGRGVLTVGRYATRAEAPAAPPRLRERVALPFDLPSGFVTAWSLRVFNWLYFHTRRAQGRESLAHPQPFFYPLDAIGGWNRAYGPRGFVQYQCVLPVVDDASPIRELLSIVQALGGVSAVSVLKDCGPEGSGTLSFPMSGSTLALDFPYRSGQSEALVDALNEFVIEAGGRIYLSKDALTRREHFARMESRLADFDAVRRRWDPDARIASALSKRLLDPPA